MPVDSIEGIQAVVFDAYGTLVEIRDRRRPYAMLLQLLADTGRMPCNDDAARLMSTPAGLAGTAQLFGIELTMSALAQLELDLLAELASVTLYPDSLWTLTSIREAGIKIGICSNLAAPYAIPVHKLLPFPLDAYAWSFDIGAVKPDPIIYSAVCHALECAPKDVLFVGDTVEADYRGPRAFGMHSVHLARKGAVQVEHTIQSLNELLSGLPSGKAKLRDQT